MMKASLVPLKQLKMCNSLGIHMFFDHFLKVTLVSLCSYGGQFSTSGNSLIVMFWTLCISSILLCQIESYFEVNRSCWNCHKLSNNLECEFHETDKSDVSIQIRCGIGVGRNNFRTQNNLKL